MGIYAEALERYLNAKWVELVAALFLWCVALILYLSLERRRLRAARSRVSRAKSRQSAPTRHAGAKRKSAAACFMFCCSF